MAVAIPLANPNTAYINEETWLSGHQKSTSGQSSNKRKQNEDNQTHEERLVKQRIGDREKRPPSYSKDAWKKGKILHCSVLKIMKIHLNLQNRLPNLKENS